MSSTESYLNHGRGIRSWLLTLDHKRIGVMYLISILSAFFLGGMFAILIRTELILPGRTLMDPDTYNQIFTLHGAVMIFLFIIPGIPAALGNLVLPLMLGARDVAFPRLNLLSWWLWLIGALFALTSSRSIACPRLKTSDHRTQDLYLLRLAFLGPPHRLRRH